MSYDVRRFLFVISFSLFIGFIFNAYAVCLATGLILFYFWQYYQFKQLLIWLRKRHHTYGPEQSGFVDDICKEIEQIRERHSTREKKLSRFLNRFQKATGALPDAVIVLGLNGEIDWANKKAEEYLGIIWPKDSGLRIANLLRKNDLTNYINRENPSAQEIFNFKSPVNATLQLELRVSPYGDMQKLLVARDVSENLKINQMRKDFIANASHELRTPLTVVSGYLESFVDDDLCPPEWLAFIRQMRAQTTRMQTLIEDLLILSRLEANQDETEKDVVHVPNMINSIVNEAITLSGVMQHEIESSIDAQLMLLGDRSQLYSAFSNIIFNAIRYTPQQSRIEIKWLLNGENAELVVIDNGPGFEKEHIPRLTERFYRIDKGRSREQGGTGLGLAIVKHVLAGHEANLSIDSDVGKGSKFICTFPAIRSVNGNINQSLSA